MRAEGAAARVTEEIIQFLIARLDEDEAASRIAEAEEASPWSTDSRGENIYSASDNPAHPFAIAPWGDLGVEVSKHIARWDPARVLADIAAKRRIVLERPWPSGRNWDLVRAWHDTTVRLFALQYAAHPDYREEWRP